MKKRRKDTPPRVARSARAAHPECSTHAARKQRRGVFALAPECTVAEAGSLRSGLATLLEDPDTVTLDIGAVQRIDTAGLQVIAAFVREREALGRPVEWRGEAPALSTAARLLGLTPILKLRAGV